MDRKTMIRKYKETALPAGVFRVRNNTLKKSLVGSSTNLPGMINRQRFELQHGSHPNRELQQDWDVQGRDAFAFDTLDLLEPSGEEGHVTPEDLQALLQMWCEKLKASGEQLYGRP